MPTLFSIANINPGTVRHEFMVSVMGAVEHERSLNALDVHLAQYFPRISGPYLDVARNDCVQWFLGTDSDWLLFIDSDISFQPHQPFSLIQDAVDSGVKVLGGVYFNAFTSYHERFNGIRPVVYNWQHDPQIDARNLLPLTWDDLPDKESIQPVDALGTGFLAIHRSVFVAMDEHFPPPLRYFAEVVVPGGIWMGEDLTFCLRAASLGFQPYVDCSVVVSHIKPMGLRPDHAPISPVQPSEV